MKAKVLVWSEKRKYWMQVTQRDVNKIMEMPTSSIHVVVNRRGEFLLYQPDKKYPGMGQWDRMPKVEVNEGMPKDAVLMKGKSAVVIKNIKPGGK